MFIDTTELDRQCKTLWPDIFEDFVPDFYGTNAASIVKMRSMLLAHAKAKCSFCKDCSNWEKAEPIDGPNSHLAVWGDGLVTAPIFILGNTMDYISEKSGMPFASHQPNNDEGVFNLNKSISNTGLIRCNTNPTSNILSPLYIAYARKCPGIQKPEFCWKWLQVQLFLIQPLVIIAMGSAAADSLRGKHIPTKINFAVIDAELTDFRKEHRIPDCTSKVLICSSPNITKNGLSVANKLKGLASIDEALRIAKKEVTEYYGRKHTD
jgi:uracil-DNA glycosylase family 4